MINGPGYVYLAKFKLFDGCYKIGSTSNLIQRRNHLESLYGITDFIIFGEVDNKIKIERKLQFILYRCSNHGVISEKDIRKMSVEELLNIMPLGHFYSQEYFRFDEVELNCAIELFKSNCQTVGCLT